MTLISTILLSPSLLKAFPGHSNIENLKTTKKQSYNGLVSIKNSTFSNDLTANGSISIKNSTFKMMHINGNLSAKDSNFNGEVTFNGPASIKESSFKSLVITKGPLSVKKCHFDKKVSIKGPLHSAESHFEEIEIFGPIFAEKTIFTGKIKAHTSSLILRESKVLNSITIISNTGFRTPYVCLANEALVKDISFTSKKGEVYIEDAKSKIAGKISNGILIKKKCPKN